MRPPARSVATTIAAIGLAAVALGCASTFQYRAVQSNFMEAAHLDNLATVDPLSESTAEASYASIVTELTPEKIAGLDPKLRGNAWVIRGYSQWRSGQYAGAVTSAESGLATDALGPRDRVLLTLLPALAVDSEVKVAWAAKLPSLTEADYAPLGKDFATAYRQVTKARGLYDQSTAPSTKYYVAYQEWRLVNDWQIVIGTLDRESEVSAARAGARAAAETILGGKFAVVLDAARESIPKGHPLREMIAAQSGA
ncbi:MAG TPA: hypothetical protein VGR62_08100 [Candidatus Binatia bacterium]|jgi:hypothetical protein|nr:hypothetical protein [Candidatus Binatia bacterium]